MDSNFRKVSFDEAIPGRVAFNTDCIPTASGVSSRLSNPTIFGVDSPAMITKAMELPYRARTKKVSTELREQAYSELNAIWSLVY